MTPLGRGPGGLIATVSLRKHAPLDTITLGGRRGRPPYSAWPFPTCVDGTSTSAAPICAKNAAHLVDLKINRPAQARNMPM
jgi:hypothetical protein